MGLQGSSRIPPSRSTAGAVLIVPASARLPRETRSLPLHVQRLVYITQATLCFQLEAKQARRGHVINSDADVRFEDPRTSRPNHPTPAAPTSFDEMIRRA